MFVLMGLGYFGGFGGLDNVFVGFLGVDLGKSLKAKAIDLGRFAPSGFTPAFGRAEAPSGAALLRHG